MENDSTSRSLPPFVSLQVTEARRFFLNLNPNREADLEVVCGGVERMHADYCVERTDFPYYAIEFVTQGQGVLEYAHGAYDLSPGSVFAYGPLAPHRIQNKDPGGMRKYYVDFVGTSQILQQTGLEHSPGKFHCFQIGSIHDLAEAFDMLIREGTADTTHAPPICATLLSLLALQITKNRLPLGSRTPQSYETFERIRAYIESNFLVLQSARDVANRCEVTPVYLSRLFQKYSDCGAYQYLLRRKMNYAAGLLMNEGMRVKDVAEQLGFADAFQFSRCFKRIYGVPPTQISNR